MRRHATSAMLGVFALAQPAAAAPFTPPEGCASFLTVQHKGCSVTIQWRCDSAPDADFWAASFSSEGLESVVSYSADYQWLDATYMWDSSREVFTPPAADPISLSALVETGIDTFDFSMRRSTPVDSHEIRVVGADMLTGESTEVDGYVLDMIRTRIRITAEDGTVEYAAEGSQYLSRAMGHFFLGVERVTEADGSITEYDDSPVDIIEPGEPGFGDTTPLYECNLQEARMPSPAPLAGKARQKETTHDDL